MATTINGYLQFPIRYYSMAHLMVFFKPGRGLCQGDPLSPFLFVLVTEVLSRIIKREEQRNKIHGIKISRSAPPITNLLFVDDVILFCRANSGDARAVHHCLQTYARWSGQVVNVGKSFIHFSNNMNPDQKEVMTNIFRLPPAQKAVKYLGLPLCMPKSKRQSMPEYSR